MVILLNCPGLTLSAVWNTATLLFVFAPFLYIVAFYHIATISFFPPFFCPFNLSCVCISHSSSLSFIHHWCLQCFVLQSCSICSSLYFIVLLLHIHSWLSFILEYYNTILTPYIHHSPQMKNLILPFQYFPLLLSNTENNSDGILVFFFFNPGGETRRWGGRGRGVVC